MKRKIQGFTPLDIHLVFTVGEVKAHLSSPFHYIDKDGTRHTAAPKMITDGISYPTIKGHKIAPPFASPWLASALIHDAGCLQCRDVRRDVGRKQALQLRKSYDELFHEMLLFQGCGKWKAWIMYKAVRTGAVALWATPKPENQR